MRTMLRWSMPLLAVSLGTMLSMPKGRAETTAGEAQVLALAKQAIRCPWRDNQLDFECAAFAKWNASPLLEGGKADATLVRLIEDPDVKLRFVAINAISSKGKAYMTDATLAKRLIAAAPNAPIQAGIPNNLGVAIGKIKLQETGTSAAVKVLLEKSAPEMQAGILSSLLWENPDEDALFAVTKQLVASPAKDTRRAAVRALDHLLARKKHADTICPLLVEWSTRKDAPEDVVGLAAKTLTGATVCAAQVDRLLGGIEQRASNGEITDRDSASALGELLANSDADAAAKQRAITICKRIVENDANAFEARTEALQLVRKHDKRAGRALMKKYPALREQDGE